MHGVGERVKTLCKIPMKTLTILCNAITQQPFGGWLRSMRPPKAWDSHCPYADLVNRWSWNYRCLELKNGAVE